MEIRGKRVGFSSRVLKSGEVAYYRDGKRVTSPYQRRVAKGVLSGKTPSQARGHRSFSEKWGSKRLTEVEIAQQEEFHLGNWATSPKQDKAARRQVRYYAKVWVTRQSFLQVGSDLKDMGGEACVPATLTLYDPDVNDQKGFRYGDLKRRFERVLRFTLQKYGLELCTGNLERDVISFWRHNDTQ